MKGSICKNRFKGKIILITGAAGIIGRETAIRAAKEGAKLVLADKNKIEGELVCKEIMALGAEATFIHIDLTRASDVKRMIKRTLELYQGLDIAIHNAGTMGIQSPLHMLDKKDMDMTLADNFYTVYFCCKEELKVMMESEKGGVIINNASMIGLSGEPEGTAYLAAKYAVNGLTNNIEKDYAKYNIKVRSINQTGKESAHMEAASLLELVSKETAYISGKLLEKEVE